MSEFAAHSAFVRITHAALERNRIASPPPFEPTRELVDHPVCTPDEREGLVREFGLRLDGVVAWCEYLGALPILIIPAGNEGGYQPGRSVLPGSTSGPEREAFAQEFLRARSIERVDPIQAREIYRRLISKQPGFADTHYRLGKLLSAAGEYAAARECFESARELDGMPMRCTNELQDGYRAVAKKRDVVLVDGPAVLRKMTPDGLLDERIFHDAQHPKFRAYLALAQDVLDQLLARKAFDEPTAANPPVVIDPKSCAEEFGLDRDIWVKVCERSASFYRHTAFIRFDPTDSLALAADYRRASHEIAAGKAPEDVGIPGLGVDPRELRPPAPASRY